MAVGDATTTQSSIADSAYLTIQPGSGVEWVIRNIWAGGAAEVYTYDGTNEVKLGNIQNANPWLSYSLILTNSYYVRVKNISGGAVYIGYSGVVSSE